MTDSHEVTVAVTVFLPGGIILDGRGATLGEALNILRTRAAEGLATAQASARLLDAIVADALAVLAVNLQGGDRG